MIVGLLVACCAFALFSPQIGHKLEVLRSEPVVESTRRIPTARLTRLVACFALAAGATLVMGGWVGLIVGILLGVVAWRLVLQLERHANHKPHSSLLAQAPVVCDLLAAVVAAGTDLVSALESVAAAVDKPVAPLLTEFAARMRLGASASVAAAALGDSEIMQPMVMAIVRSAESGAPLSDALRRAGADLRMRRRAALLSRARVLGVRAVIPLGVCFLPAFVLLGVVPVVVSLVSQVLTDLPR